MLSVTAPPRTEPPPPWRAYKAPSITFNALEMGNTEFHAHGDAGNRLFLDTGLLAGDGGEADPALQTQGGLAVAGLAISVSPTNQTNLLMAGMSVCD